jgi:hypothetical protein
MPSLRIATAALILLSVAAFLSFIGTDLSYLSVISIERRTQINYHTEMKFAFENEKVDSFPKGFTSHIAGGGAQGDWRIIRDDTAPSGSLVLAQTSQDATPAHFPILTLNASSYSDGKFSTRVKPVAGNTDRAGGIVFKFLDPQNYYVARINAIEDNVQLYRFIGGRRIALGSAEVGISSNHWHLLEVELLGSTIRCYVDEKLLIEKDSDIVSGNVGLWTKSDSIVYFDDFTIYRR